MREKKEGSILRKECFSEQKRIRDTDEREERGGGSSGVVSV